MKIKLGLSTCPNDTFIFDAIVNKKINLYDLEFDVLMADVEELNVLAFKGELDMTKISFHAYGYIADKYKILSSGSALGFGNGPLLIAKKYMAYDQIPLSKIAIPGRYTTANLLLHIAFPQANNLVEMLFSEIESAVLEEKADIGLIIHESRFTYEEKGLVKLMDLGQFWEQSTALPCPLGGIIVKRSLPVHVQNQLNEIMRKSVLHAMNNPSEPEQFMRKYAQEMDPEVMYSHVNLYVNEFTKDLGTVGRQAIITLLRKAMEIGMFDSLPDTIFV